MLVRKGHKFPAGKYFIFVVEGWVVTIIESVAVCLFLGSWWTVVDLTAPVG
jgi:hypothetical protein